MSQLTKEELAKVLELHAAWLGNREGGVRADLSGADLRRADLRGANLRGAYLRGADLRGADLGGADLSGAYLGGAYLNRADLGGADLSGAYLSLAYLNRADLGGADLSRANLGGAYLRGADLRGANLSGADLSGADLRGAKLDDASEIEPSLTWKQYKEELVPALLVAGGKPLAEVVEASWECHSWDNCPMAVAFDVHDLNHIPTLYREQARRFVMFFDAKMLPRPEIKKAEGAA